MNNYLIAYEVLEEIKEQFLLEETTDYIMNIKNHYIRESISNIQNLIQHYKNKKYIDPPVQVIEHKNKNELCLFLYNSDRLDKTDIVFYRHLSKREVIDKVSSAIEERKLMRFTLNGKEFKNNDWMKSKDFIGE